MLNGYDVDMHMGNILVKLQASDSDIQRYLEENPSQIHPPQYDLHVSAEPIITVKSQPLPNIGTNTSLTNIEICLVDYSASASPTLRYTSKLFTLESRYRYPKVQDEARESNSGSRRSTSPGADPRSSLVAPR